VVQLKNIVFALIVLSLPLSTPARADKAMLVLDSSGSMNAQINGKTKIQIAREVVNGLVEGWPQNTDLGLIAYGHREKDNCGDIQTLVQPVSNSWPAIKAAVGDIAAKGKTPITDAVRAAARELHSEEGKATVILVSDGLETCNADPCAAAAELEKAGVDFTVHVVGFGTTAEENRQLQCIADKTGGRFLGASNASELKTAMTKTVELVAKPEPPKQNVVKVGANIGKLKLINAERTQEIYAQDGKRVAFVDPGKVYDFQPGTYDLVENGRVTVRGVEIRAGEELPLNMLERAGKLKVINAEATQEVYAQDGKRVGFVDRDKAYDFLPGTYDLVQNGRVTVQGFEIRAGQTAPLNMLEHAGKLKIINTDKTHEVYAQDGKRVTFVDANKSYDIRPGKYDLVQSGRVVVQGFEIPVGQETVLDFNN
jgi:hypothetical protein